MADETVRASVALPRDALAPGLARRLVRGVCEEAGVAAAVSEVVVLLTSETVTNAVLHGRGRLRLTAALAFGRIRVEVADGSRRPLVVRPVDDRSEHGRGSRLLQQCASRWGIDLRRRGKTVWFEVPAA